MKIKLGSDDDKPEPIVKLTLRRNAADSSVIHLVGRKEGQPIDTIIATFWEQSELASFYEVSCASLGFKVTNRCR